MSTLLNRLFQIFEHTFPFIDHSSYRFMSTMETETVSSRNVVDLLLREEFNSAICPPSTTPDGDSAQNTLLATNGQSKAPEDFVLGFDC